jgi:hypothetical protein
MNRAVCFTLTSALFGITGLFAQSQNASLNRDLAPTGKGIGTLYNPGQAGDHAGGQRMGDAGAGNKTDNGIYYHNGPVMSGTVNMYYIWYGNWPAENTASTILSDFGNNIGNNSDYFNINQTYSPTPGAITGSVLLIKQTSDAYSMGKDLSDAKIQAIVANAINNNALPKDPNGVYFVLTSADVTATSGFCSRYCGWHTYFTLSGTVIKYSFVGNPDRCPSACSTQTTSPNGNAGADGMASIIAHELEEAVTDPQLNAWYDRRGYENADKCAWTFGQTYTAPNGSLANVKLGSRDYLIQQNWVNDKGGYCAMKRQ